MSETRSFAPVLIGDDRDLDMIKALARAEVRLERAKLIGVGVSEAEEIKRAAYETARILFDGRT